MGRGKSCRSRLIRTAPSIQRRNVSISGNCTCHYEHNGIGLMRVTNDYDCPVHGECPECGAMEINDLGNCAHCGENRS
jgi:hypothetical protein